MGSNIHVVPREGRWAVELEGGHLVGLGYSTEEDACRVARELARRNDAELILEPAEELAEDQSGT